MNIDPLRLGFRLHYFRDLANAGTTDLRTVRMDGNVPFSLQERCPACEIPLSTLCTFIAKKDARRIRLGCCGECGYIGYIDRPTQEWMNKYYEEEWDNAKSRNVKEEAKQLKHGVSPEQRDALLLAKKLGVSYEALICDIGCGNGAILKEFANLGFQNLIGVENSCYRAELTREKYGFKTLIGNFENSDIKRELEKVKPVGLFFSSHVFEHIYDPRAALAICRDLQNEGGHFIAALPDAEFEPAVITLFWLPHLHAHTRRSFERLLNRYGYEVVADNFTYKRLMLAGCKVRQPVSRYSRDGDYRSKAAKRLHEWFFINRMEKDKRYRVSWTSKTYHTDLARAASLQTIDAFLQGVEHAYDFFAARLLDRFTNRRSLVISPLEKRFTSPEESPLEIQYEGDIEFLLR